QVHQRLDLIRYIHGLACGVNLSVAQLRGLWEILTSPAERELCLSFLQEGASTPKIPMDHLHTAFGDKERVFLFRELICKDVNWAGLGMPAYSCFDAFFKRIWSETVTAAPAAGLKGDTQAAPAAAASAVEPEEDLTELGVDTLWRVTLTSLNKEVAESATNDLLEVYNTPEMQRRTRAAPYEDAAAASDRALQQQQQQQRRDEPEAGREQKKTRPSSSSATEGIDTASDQVGGGGGVGGDATAPLSSTG
ncbi:unnamed protein product, partial [Ectocarpus sp. 12 AP-2014]